MYRQFELYIDPYTLVVLCMILLKCSESLLVDNQLIISCLFLEEKYKSVTCIGHNPRNTGRLNFIR